MPNPLKSPRGTRDILPQQQPLWELVISTCQSVARQLGFQPITIPTFEETALFQRTLGQGTDIIDKELFLVQGRQEDGSQYALRPEGTAGVVRAYIEHGMHTWPQPVKLASCLSVFRYDRPQRGRFREFYQFDLEYFSERSAFADAMVILANWQALQKLGITGVILHVNSLGSSEERAAYRQTLTEYLAPLSDGLSEDSKRRLESNPLRILDSKDAGDRRIVAGAPKLADALGDGSRAHYAAVLEYLDSWSIPYLEDPLLVRGLDYYSDTCFEWIRESGSELPLAIGGGGRYDALVGQLGGPAIGAVGAGLGLDRIVDILESAGWSADPARPDAYVALGGPEALSAARQAVLLLTRRGLAVEADFTKPSLGAQLKAANRLKARYAVIIGTDEAANSMALVKNLDSGEQRAVPFQGLAGLDFA